MLGWWADLLVLFQSEGLWPMMWKATGYLNDFNIYLWYENIHKKNSDLMVGTSFLQRRLGVRYLATE